jgi:hypothetical protein
MVVTAFAARSLVGIAAGLAVSAVATADAPANWLEQINHPDPRVARLERFFKYYGCDAPFHTFDYLRAADAYGLDYRLLPAISIRETCCGKGAQQENNFWGFHPGHQSFPSVPEGIDFIAQRVTQHPAYKGKSLDGKLFTYNPLPAYPGEVKRIMRQIE